ncbi:DsbA family protein [Chloroflexota bacterium]
MAKLSLALEVYFDYSCPYSYTVADWLGHVAETSEMELAVNWRYFSVAQVNNPHGHAWKIWEQPLESTDRGIRAFRAAEAVRWQGAAAFERFHFALFKARYEEQRDIDDLAVLKAVASIVGIDVVQFEKDLASQDILSKLARDHSFAVETLGVFGTPTLVFPDGQAIFLKLSTQVPSEDAVSVLSELHHLVARRTYILEVKRP